MKVGRLIEKGYVLQEISCTHANICGQVTFSGQFIVHPSAVKEFRKITGEKLL